MMEKPRVIKCLGYQYPKKSQKRKYKYFLFECPFCGKEFRSRNCNVSGGTTVSCGCYNKESSRKRMTKHGLNLHPIYKIWNGIIQRCHNPNNNSYKEYGGKNITVCIEWRFDFIKFYLWSMENGYSKGLVCDRINNELGYNPENCRWATWEVSNQNTKLLRKNNTSGRRGVRYNKIAKKWVARCYLHSKENCLGYFDTIDEASLAYNNFVISNGLRNPLNPV